MICVDWGAAPVDAEAYHPGSDDTFPAFFKMEGDKVAMWIDHGRQKFWRTSGYDGFPHESILRPCATWSGEGLPPIGVRLECGYAFENFSVWHKATCVAVGIEPEGRQVCVTQSDTGVVALYRSGAHIRPIKTPEQLAAELKEKDIDLMHAIITGSPYNPAEALYEAGYRKQVAE